MSLYIQDNASLKGFNTFSVPVKARRLCFITSLQDLQEASDLLYMTSMPKVLFLGAGSDILFVQDFPGAVFLNRLRGMEATENSDFYHVRAASGEPWIDFVNYTVENGMPGLENLSLIPGTVGGAVIQNIGAYGREIAEFVHSVECFSIKTGERFLFNNEECDFGYRTSVFKQSANWDLFITAVNFHLPRNWRPWLQYRDLAEAHANQPLGEVTPATIKKTVEAIRNSKLPDPQVLPNAGSFFKNPILSKKKAKRFLEKFPSAPLYNLGGRRYKASAAWLIDHAKMKGVRQGDAGTYEKQPLVIVNHGQATGRDISEFAHSIKKEVKRVFGIKLEPEVVIVE